MGKVSGEATARTRLPAGGGRGSRESRVARDVGDGKRKHAGKPVRKREDDGNFVFAFTHEPSTDLNVKRLLPQILPSIRAAC